MYAYLVMFANVMRKCRDVLWVLLAKSFGWLISIGTWHVVDFTTFAAIIMVAAFLSSSDL